MACSLGFQAITLNAVLLRKSPFLKSSQCGTEPVGIAFWPPCCAENATDTHRQSDGRTDGQNDVTLGAHARRGFNYTVSLRNYTRRAVNFSFARPRLLEAKLITMDTLGSSSVGPEGPLDNATAAKLLKDHAVMVTRNVNSIALKPYLLQNNCITLEEAKQFNVESPRSESNLKLISIICQRGVSAFNGFLQALTQFTADEPGEGAHAELLDTLKRETAKIPLSPRRAPDVSNYTAQASISSRYTTQASASSSDVNTEGSTVRGYSPIPEEMEVQPLRADDSVERDMSQPQVAADQRRGGGMPRHMQGDSQVGEKDCVLP